MIGIVILNYNTFDETKRCVESIIENEKDLSDKRLFVVDNASTDGSGEKLKSLYGEYSKCDITFIQSEKNRGFSGGNNLGIKGAIGQGCEYIFILNSDIKLLNDAISIMTKYLSNHSEVEAIGPYIVDGNGKYTQVARKGLEYKDIFFPKKRLYEYDINKEFIFEGMIYGCCFGMRSEFIKNNDLLDEKIFLNCEEDAIAHVMKKTGAKSCIIPNARVMHLEGASLGNAAPDKLAKGRYNRWISELYVLKEYAKCNDRQLKNVRTYRNAFITVMRMKYPKFYNRYI